MAIVAGCPAFQESCPFAISDVGALPEVMALLPKSTLENCPAFKDGCPFKHENSVETLYNKLSEMPSTHRMGQMETTKASDAVAAMLRLVHERSTNMKSKLGAGCSVFATSCPFKTVTSDGQPMVAELDRVIASWSLTDSTPSPAIDVASLSLSKALKAGTKSVHRAAENVRFVRDFLCGAVPKDSYVELLRALYHVYDALEKELDLLPADYQHIDFTVLKRVKALEADLRYYTGTPADKLLDLGPMSAVTAEYVAQIHKAAKQDPVLVISHAYTRYLGDLSGGQILAKAAKKTYGLQGDCGTAFYNFEALVGGEASFTSQAVKSFKKKYRETLDALCLSPERADAAVSEACSAFLLNMLIFEERDVAAGHLNSVRSLTEAQQLVVENRSALRFQQAYLKESPKDKCPFLPAAGTSTADTGVQHRAACPWPFVWMHEPRSALISHPAKNVSLLAGLYMVYRFARAYPVGAALSGVVAGVLMSSLMPKHSKKSMHKD